MCSTSFKKGMLLTALCFLLSGPAVQSAEEPAYLYQWKDDRGVVNLTDSLEKVPPEFRSRATRLPQPADGKNEQSRGEIREGGQSRGIDVGTLRDQEEAGKAQWQERMRDARRRLRDAEDRYSRIELRRNELASAWRFTIRGRPTEEMLNEMNRLDEELEKAKIDVVNARNEVEVTIPDEARRANIPPGWLREAE